MIVLETLSAILKIIGVGFLLLAAVGVYRLKDPFMRMHAATKAGTLGAGLVAIATSLTATDWTTALSGLATAAFLLMTLPVASHLLGRATYVSGAAFDGAGARDALAGVITRAPVPLEERLFAPPGVDIRDEEPQAPQKAPVADLADLFEATIKPRPLDQLLVTALDGLPPAVVARSQAFARAEGVEPTLIAFLDQALLEDAPDKASRDEALAQERARLSALVQRFETAAMPEPALAVQYAEGDPYRLLARFASADGLLVAPTQGWFSHGVDLAVASYARSSDRLLGFVDSYPGHALLVPPEIRPVTRVIAVDDGSTQFLANLAFAIHKRLWGEVEYVVTGPGDPEAPTVRRLVVSSVLNGTGARWRFAGADESEADIAAHCEAAILHSLEKPLRTDWYGVFWQDRVAAGWRGEILVG
jgi:monovalent cation/proton antiporter MnhG/PhaG subunit